MVAVDQRTAGDAPEELGDDGYSGPAELVAGDTVIPVQVVLSGQVEPISGRYAWYGRVGASEQVTALMAQPSARDGIRLRTPWATVETALSDVDPWGRPRVSGSGRIPFPVLDRLPGEQAAGEPGGSG